HINPHAFRHTAASLLIAAGSDVVAVSDMLGHAEVSTTLNIYSHAIEAAQEHFGATVIDIEAQEYARGFYEKVGFKQSSAPFILDGIPHIKMTWQA
ncbi:MAG: GNAT family N-acetyltransferase, partial [Muribaculaceae bacterium]|nr:GNAT family N-acetyltransferase [Muribaculaceae bacterium]